jgi:hypothetical protein
VLAGALEGLYIPGEAIVLARHISGPGPGWQVLLGSGVNTCVLCLTRRALWM